jgi:predicted transposase/invertase (TIGR01784 family)
VLYNGSDEFPDQKTLKLSDMYSGSGMAGSAELELTVKVFNINKGRNEEISRRSETLNGYGIFVSLVKEYVKSMNRDSAILKAIDVCIRQNVLKRFLEENASEVRNMLLTEWDSDKALKIAKEEAREDGWAEGFFQTAKAMLAKGMSIALISEITGLREEEIEGIR